MRAFAPSLSAAPAHYPYEDPQSYVFTDHASVKSSYEVLTHQHGTSAYAPSTLARSQYEGLQLYEFTDRACNSGHEILTHQSGYAPSMLARSQYEVPQVYDHANNGHEIPTYQHSTSGQASGYAPSSSAMSARSQYEDRQLYADHPSFNSRHEIVTHQHETLGHAPSSSMPARSQYEDPQHYAVTNASFNSGHEHGTLDYRDATDAPSLSAMSAQPQYEDPQLYALTDHASSNSGHETAAEQQDNHALPRSVTPTLSHEPVDAQPNEPTSSIPSECPICGERFKRMQERGRHLGLYLPHSVHCPTRGCPWTGRRQWDLKTHWKKKHPKAGPVPRKEKNELYEPEDFIKSILDGASPVDVAQSAFLKAKKKLRELGKVDEGANLWGRKRKLDIVI